MSVNAVGNVNVNYVNSYRDSLKQRKKTASLLTTSGLAAALCSSYIKSNAIGLSLAICASLAGITGVVDLHKTDKELKELDNQQKLNIEI